MAKKPRGKHFVHPRKRSKERYLEWLTEPYNAARGETTLWIAVITQALMDALSRSHHAEARYHKHEAMRWLTENTKDFITVCLYAGLDPDYVRQNAKRTLASPTRWRAEPGQGKRYAERKAYRDKLKAQSALPAALPTKTISHNIIPFPNHS